MIWQLPLSKLGWIYKSRSPTSEAQSTTFNTSASYTSPKPSTHFSFQPPLFNNGVSLQNDLKASNELSQIHLFKEHTHVLSSIGAPLSIAIFEDIASNSYAPISVTSPLGAVVGSTNLLSRHRHQGLQIFVSGYALQCQPWSLIDFN
ncbi:uncharacterized protein LOC130994956 isoform X2 [Salvia miltiorrhiza]|uniref:uncharacterized protein LOC130994956 isoform X2 n=1 Tax=Salvia miltiorrhiza TaxID=226208 RepID=UPI0025AB970A|nr:uncharacterized protein LOC130994956 isoform X2 [Salvia miltiorrhiza]